MMHKIRILVVDDHAITREATASIVAQLGFEVDKAATGTEALKLFGTTEYATVILDCVMPGLNGFECAKEIRSREEGSGRRTPIIGFTSIIGRDIEEQCLRAGMDAYVPKDCSTDTLWETILNWVVAAEVQSDDCSAFDTKKPSGDITSYDRPAYG